MRVELVTGPPGSGKSTLARERMRRGDVLLDMDRLWVALTGLEEYDKANHLLPLVKGARDAVLARIGSVAGLQRTVMVACAATRGQRVNARRLTAWPTSLTVLEVPAAQCLRRIKAQGRKGTQDWKALVEEWWGSYQRPSPDEGWTGIEVLRV